MLSSYIDKLVFSDNQGRKAITINNIYHVKAHLFRIDIFRIYMIAIYFDKSSRSIHKG